MQNIFILQNFSFLFSALKLLDFIFLWAYMCDMELVRHYLISQMWRQKKIYSISPDCIILILDSWEYFVTSQYFCVLLKESTMTNRFLLCFYFFTFLLEKRFTSYPQTLNEEPNDIRNVCRISTEKKRMSEGQRPKNVFFLLSIERNSEKNIWLFNKRSITFCNTFLDPKSCSCKSFWVLSH